ncbi:MAG: fructosamine kinase family protein [Halieaceae bacterium]
MSITRTAGEEQAVNRLGRVRLEDGSLGFRKSAPAASLEAEAAGLAAIADTGTLPTPAILSLSPQELLTRWVGDGAASPAGWQSLGRQLAALHAQALPQFGFTSDNYCGATPQPNPVCTDGWEFFASRRLQHQLQLARDRNLLSSSDAGRLESLCGHLRQWIPEQQAALLHGDLWRGNVVFHSDGMGYVIDPAAYWGWPEADLAMTQLFGGFPAEFYQAYLEQRPLESGWQERLPLYNLYHLLNHLNLFGASYLAQVQAVLRRYA